MINIEGEKKTFSGNRDLRNTLKLLDKKAGPKTANIVYLVTTVWREDEDLG